MADVVEPKIWDSLDPGALIPGDPAGLRDFAAGLRALGASGLVPVATGLRTGAEASCGWQGDAGEALRERVGELATSLDGHRETLERIAQLVEQYAAVVVLARYDALTAWRLYLRGDAYVTVGRYLDAAAMHRDAAGQLQDARISVATSAKLLAEALRGATALVRRNPSFWSEPLWHVKKYGQELRSMAVNLATLWVTDSPGRLWLGTEGYSDDLALQCRALAAAFGTPGKAWDTLTDSATRRESGARWAAHLTPAALAVAGRAGLLSGSAADTVAADAASTAEATSVVPAGGLSKGLSKSLTSAPNFLVDGNGVVQPAGELAPVASTPPPAVATSPDAISYADLGSQQQSPAVVGTPATGGLVEHPAYTRLYVNEYDRPEAGAGVRMWQREDGTVAFSVEKLPGTPTGEKMFAEAYANFPDAKGITGDWTESLPDNLDSFNQAVRAGIPEGQAVWLNFTGRTAARYGMQQAEITKLIGEPGHYTAVRVRYLPPE